MTDGTQYEKVAPLVGGMAHLRIPSALSALCGRTMYWVAAAEDEKVCQHCRDVQEKRER